MKTGGGLNVILGYFCNYKCGHCVSSSGPQRRKDEMTEEDFERLKSGMQARPPTLLLFTGGEPTLSIPAMNRVISLHPDPSSAQVAITTNGWFASSAQKIASILSQITQLNKVQMSADVFHGNESKFEWVSNLAGYCQEHGIEFNVTMCISEPMQLAAAKEMVEKLGIKVTFQPVTGTGRAAETGAEFQYPLFEKETLKEKCPILQTGRSYFPRQGYSVCCSNLVFSKQPLDVIHPTEDEHLESKFFKNLSQHTMGELARIYGVDLSGAGSSQSHVCGLCEYIHSRAKLA
jgi:MoaA/NifB/PqqE/SkfB family radical SAM enzyme